MPDQEPPSEWYSDADEEIFEQLESNYQRLLKHQRIVMAAVKTRNRLIGLAVDAGLDPADIAAAHPDITAGQVEAIAAKRDRRARRAQLAAQPPRLRRQIFAVCEGSGVDSTQCPMCGWRAGVTPLPDHHRVVTTDVS